MDKKRIITLLSMALLLAGVTVFLMNLFSKDVHENEGYSSSNWDMNLSLDNKDPFGLYIFKELAIAEGRFNEFNTYLDFKKLDSVSKVDSSLIMFIGQDLLLTQQEIDLVLNSVGDGNNLFISSKKLPKKLINTLFETDPRTFYPSKKATHSINNQSLDFHYIFENDTLTKLWEMFNPKDLESSTKILSTIFSRPVYIEVEYGLGKIYFHQNPMVFTNIQLINAKGKSYLKEVFSYLPSSKIQWLSFAEFEPKKKNPNDGKFNENQSLLSILFTHPAFRWGFILAIFGLMLYLIFRSKRSRPIIPAIHNNQNTGFSYVDTLAGIYFNKNNQDKILKIMRRNFFTAVYDHFYIDLAKRENNKPIIALAKKTNIPEAEIIELLKFLEVTTQVSDIFLSNVFKLQRSFYYRSGIWNEKVVKQLQEEQVLIYRKKEFAYSFLVTGVLLIVFGFVFLSMSIGLGVLLWPLGILVLVFGTNLLSKAYLKIEINKLTVYSLLKKKRKLLFENINFIEEKEPFTVIYLNDSTKIKINRNHLEEDDKRILHKLYQRFKED